MMRRLLLWAGGIVVSLFFCVANSLPIFQIFKFEVSYN